MDNKERFYELVSKINRPGSDKLLSWLEKSDFFKAPASTRFHGCYEGGLLEHSLDVYDCFKQVQKAYPEINVPEESVIIATLFHDLCKVNYYAPELRWRKDANNQWEQYEVYTADEKFAFGGHGSKSVYILQNFFPLTADEAVAINCHMGPWEEGAENYLRNVYERNHFAWLVHVADEAATYLMNRHPEAKTTEK